MFRSEYYLDFVRPLRGFDTIGLTVSVDKEGSLATFHLHHASERGVRFGERGLALLRLIEPAFRVGVSLSLSGSAPTPLHRRRARDLKSVLPMLSSRELAVVEMLGARHTNREIAAALGVAPGTIKRHVENILQKTGVRSRRDIEPLLDRPS
jgi:DNA-binding CsgD family transcriptional regulator